MKVEAELVNKFESIVAVEYIIYVCGNPYIEYNTDQGFT